MKQRWIICEDGSEYFERFARFLDGEFEFVAAPDAASLLAALGTAASGVILDLDFRRTPPESLIDEQGASPPPPGEATRRRLAETQGLLILRLLRAAGDATPVLLFADLDDAERATYLERSFAPVEIVPSNEGLLQTAERMRRR